MGTPRRPSRVWGSLQTSWARPQLPQGPKPRGGWGQGPGSRVGGSGGRFLVTQSLLLSLCEIHRAKNKTPRQLTRASQVSGTGRAGHLPGNLEDLAQAGSTHLTGEPCPLPPSGALGSAPCHRQTLPSPPPCSLRPAAHPRVASSCPSELGSAPCQGGCPPCCTPPPAPTPAYVCPALPVGALHSHTCSPASHARPAPCQSSTESGRASSPPLAPSVDGWVCFSLYVLGSGKKKKSPNELSLGHFSLHFSAQVSLKGTSLSVSNSFALNSSRSFARAV